jgi:single-strand DNA-binding protein
MLSYNRVILAGNLTRDPQLSHTSSNMPVCKFGLATNRRWRDRNSGENREETCFVDCTAFGRSGELINQYLTKGRGIFIEGRLQFSQWEAQDGGRRSKLEVVVENFRFMGEPGGAGREGGAPARGSSPGARPPAQKSASFEEPGEPTPEDYGPPVEDENVPF